ALIKRVALLFAMEQEAAPTIARLGLTPKGLLAPPLCAIAFEGTYAGLQIDVVVNGIDARFGTHNVGTVAAALTTHAVCTALAPDLIISAGTAGGFKARGGEIGDVYVTTDSVNHDRRIGIPGFTEYGVYRVAALDASTMAKTLNFKTGVTSTGNSLECAEIDMVKLTELEASTKEMELSAVAYTAGLHAVPFVGIKAVTDIVDGDKPTGEEFMQNLHTASKAIEDAVIAVLDYLDGKTLVA
ncbi:nucleoside phosphorylase domain-containing protein, partial [Pavlovales sp. CCMP2436]